MGELAGLWALKRDMGLEFGGGRRRVFNRDRQLSFVVSYLVKEGEVNPRGGGVLGVCNIAAVITRQAVSCEVRPVATSLKGTR